MAVVQVLNTGRARDNIIATCAGNIWLIAATYNMEFIFSHMAGNSNNIAGLLSHWNVTVNPLTLFLFIYLGFYVAFNTVQVISRQVVGRAEETSTYSSLGFCTVNCRPTASNYQLSHLRP